MVTQQQTVLSKVAFLNNNDGVASKWYVTTGGETVVTEGRAIDQEVATWNRLSKKDQVRAYDYYFEATFRKQGRIAKQAEFCKLYGFKTNTDSQKKEAKKLYNRYYQRERRYQNSPKRRTEGILSQAAFFEKNGNTIFRSDDEKAYWKQKYKAYYQQEYRKNYQRKSDRIRLSIELTAAQKEKLEAEVLPYKRYTKLDPQTAQLRIKNLGRFVVQCAEHYLDEKRVYRDPETLNKIMRQFKGIGSNINQVVRMVTRRELSFQETFTELKNEVNRLASAQVRYFTNTKDIFYSIEEAAKADPNFLTQLERHIAHLKKQSTNDNQK